jgi:hypothetical protein
MPCPFPGMDPFLEVPPYWSDFSPAFLTAIRNRLIPEVFPKYDVRLEEYLVLEHDDLPSHRVRPDLVVSSDWRTKSGTSVQVLSLPQSANTLEAAYPDFVPITQRRLVLTHRSTGQVVTVLELLSPVNKARGKDGIEAYESKREELLTTTCHLIELDLLRGGERLPIKGAMPSGDYFAYIGRSDRRPTCQIIGWPWQSVLPPIPLPLLPEDGETQIDLALAFKDAYDPAYYHQRLPYDSPLRPPLSEPELEWVHQQRVERSL